MTRRHRSNAVGVFYVIYYSFFGCFLVVLCLLNEHCTPDLKGKDRQNQTKPYHAKPYQTKPNFCGVTRDVHCGDERRMNYKLDETQVMADVSAALPSESALRRERQARWDSDVSEGSSASAPEDKVVRRCSRHGAFPKQCNCRLCTLHRTPNVLLFLLLFFVLLL